MKQNAQIYFHWWKAPDKTFVNSIMKVKKTFQLGKQILNIRSVSEVAMRQGGILFWDLEVIAHFIMMRQVFLNVFILFGNRK